MFFSHSVYEKSKVSVKSAALFGMLISLMMGAPHIAAQESAEKQQEGIKLPVFPWTKVCQDKKDGEGVTCLVTQELRNPNTAGVLASITIRLPEGKDPTLFVTIPPGVLLQPGLRMQVDENKPVVGQFSICYPVTCVAVFDDVASLIKSFKKGNDVVLLVMSPDGKPGGFQLTLSGFTKAFDGPSTNLAVYEKKQEELVAAIRKRAAEAAKAAEKTSRNSD